MGRPKKVKEVKEVVTKENEVNKIWEKKHELGNDYEYALQEFAWAYESLEACKKDLEKALETKINFEKENHTVLKKS